MSIGSLIHYLSALQFSNYVIIINAKVHIALTPQG